MKVIILLLVLTIASCGKDGIFSSGCGEVAEWRCNNNRVQICGASDDWETFQDCSAIGETCKPAFSTACGGFEFPCCD